MVKISIIIVTIGRKSYLGQCLDSIMAQTHPVFEIIVMDNSSQPDFARHLNLKYPSVKICSSGVNLFYAGALNKGINIARGEFILCLNDDIILDKTFIQEAINGFFVSSKIGSVNGRIMRDDRKTLDSTGLFLSPWRTAKERGYGQKDLGQFRAPGFVFGVTGSAAFYRKEMLEAVKKNENYFDNDFRMFYEDLDISWRANRCGWRAYYVPSALAYHVRGGSFRPDSGIGRPAARRYLNDRLHCDLIKNRYLTILRNETFPGLLMHFFPILIYDFFAWGYILFFRPKVVKLFFKYFLSALTLRRNPRARFDYLHHSQAKPKDYFRNE
jgi:GT2 family glycosyltransferase